MKSLKSAGLIALLLGSFLMGRSGAQDKGKEAIAQLYNAAKKEGTVVIWGPTDAIIYQRMQEVLDKQYPGIKIEHFESIPEPLVQRIIAESQTGKPAGVDIIQSGSLRALRPLIDRDMLASYPGWEKDFNLDAVYANQRFVGAYNLTLPIAYNNKMINAKDAPKSWDDLADPKWKGKKIIIEARLVPFAMLGTEWGKARATELVKKQPSKAHVLIDQGAADQFLERELQPQRFVAAAGVAGQQVTLRMQEGYDHSYYFVSTFIDDHLRWHARGLSG